MLWHVEASSMKTELANRDAGNVILLQVVVSSMPEDSPYKYRKIELDRDGSDLPWFFRTEGI